MRGLLALIDQRQLKFVDPEQLLDAIVDNGGEKFHDFEQSDVQIFFTNLVNRLQDANLESLSEPELLK